MHVRSTWFHANWQASLFCVLPCVPVLLSHGMFRRLGATSATWHQSCFRNCPTDHYGGHHMLSQMGDLYHISYSHCLTLTLLLRFFILFIVKMCICVCMVVSKASTKSAECLSFVSWIMCMLSAESNVLPPKNLPLCTKE